MIRLTFKQPQQLSINKFTKKSVLLLKEINRNSKVWYFQISKNVWYFNYNDSNIIKSIEKIKGWI